MSIRSKVFLRLDLRDPASQTLGVEMVWTPETLHQRWLMPVWTPGSYTVRDPSQHLHSLSLQQGTTRLNPRRVSPSRWSIELACLEPLRLCYQLEARQLTVRTSYLDPHFASLCLSAVAMQIEGQRWQPHALSLLLPNGWNSFVPLPVEDRSFLARDFDQLVDSPVHAGSFEAIPFSVNGFQHSLVVIGNPPMGWPESLVADVEAICSAACALMGSPPPAGDCYQLVIQLLDHGYGGLEHDHGAVLQYSWSALAKPDGYHQLLQLVGHEYLHQWNVRRLRPREYIPYDHSAPVISDGLWFAEGITSYFDLALPLLAGRSDRHTLLKDLGKDLSHVLLHPGRKIQTLADSSREAWVRLYKATPAGSDTQISYYKLGTAVAFCLDVRLRAAGASLAQVLRDLWISFGQSGRGYSRSDIQSTLAFYSPSLADHLPIWLDEHDQLPIENCLDQLGLLCVSSFGDTGWSGLSLEDAPGRGVAVKRVRHGGPGHAAGLVPGDEIVAVKGHRLYRLELWPVLLKGSERVKIAFARRGQMEETQLDLDPPAQESLSLEWNPQATPSMRQLRDRWFEIR
ncbi:MAG: signal protein PDZ [Synechococcus sp.]|nr:signal protein PDZ [Synechococcus sp.]